MGNKVLFYSDAREFGGHEALTASAVRFMARQPDLELSFIYYENNFRLHEELCDIRQGSRLTLYPMLLKSESFRTLRPMVAISKLPLLRALMKSIAPDIVVISQGNIEISAVGLLAARSASLRTISYIPMAQPLGSGSGVAFACRTMLDRYLYTMPDKFITISESVKRMLLERGAKAEISVIPNGIELNHCNGNRTKMRRAYGFSEGEYIAGVVGRIAFRQKAQDFLINAIASYKEQLEDVRFCVIGDGPDEQKLRGMIRDAKLDDRVRMLPWNSDLSSFYSALDLLIIPSRFEGVPLVMLEAMWHEVPVVASNVDGMAEVLPSEWLFQCENPESLVSVLLRVRSADNSRLLAANKKTVSEQFSLSRFQNSFHSVVADKFREPVQPAWVTSAAQTPGSSLAHRN